MKLPYFKAAPNGFHYYRRPVPPDLWEAIGRREIKKALGADLNEALRLYAKVHKEAENAISNGRAQGPVGDRQAVLNRMRKFFTLDEIALVAQGAVSPTSELADGLSHFHDELIWEYEDAEERRVPPKVSLEAIKAVGSRKLPKEVYTLDSALTHYLKAKSIGVYAKDLALRNRVNKIRARLIDVLGNAAVMKRPLEQHTRQEAIKFRDHLLGLMSAASVKRGLEVLSPAINELIKEHGLDIKNRFASLSIKGASNNRDRRAPLSEQDMTVLAPVMETEDALGALWITLRDTGARLGEVCNLRAMDIDHANQAIMIRAYGEHTLKTANSERTVPLSPASYTAIKPLAEGRGDEEKLFPSYAGPRRSEGASAALMKRLRTVVADRKKVVHSLRHRMKDLLRLECAEALAQEIMGHSGQKIAFNYGAGYALEAKRKALEKVW
jgi:integrase